MKERFSKAKIDTFLRQQYMIRGIKIRVVDMAFVAVMIILSFIVRIKLFPIETYDYFYYVDWLRQTKAGGGFFSLANKISDYNSPYMYILCLLSIFPGKEITLLKMVPVIFDYIAGIYVMKIIYKMTRNTHTAILGLMAFLLLPTVVINGAYWGQCDIIYCTFLLGTLYYCMSAEYGKAFVFLGIAFAFKLQGLFLLPFLIILYLCENKIKLRNFLFIPAVYFISEIPAWIMGRNLWELLTIYVGQAESYDWGTSEYPNIYAILAEASPEAHHPLEVGQAGTFCVIMILGFLAYYTYRSKVKFDKDLILLLALFSTAVFTYGLPHMHERYGFILDILVVIYAVVNKKRVLMAAGFEAVSLLAYMPFLFGKRLIPIQYSAVILLFLIVLVGYDYVQLIQKRKAEEAVTVDLEMYD